MADKERTLTDEELVARIPVWPDAQPNVSRIPDKGTNVWLFLFGALIVSGSSSYLYFTLGNF